MANEYLDAALTYAQKQGWYVFPLLPGIKKPRKDFEWRELSTTDPDQIRKWWTDWPKSNIAVDCAKSGLVVIDLDVRPNVNGLEVWADLKEEFCVNGDTLVQHSARAGQHLVFDNLGYEIGNPSPWPGINVKGDGGYFVVEPSRFHGKPYTWEVSAHPFDGQKPATLPEPLARFLEEKTREMAKGKIEFSDTMPDVSDLGALLGRLNADPKLFDWILGGSDSLARQIRRTRSEAEYITVVELRYCGASCDTVRAIFQNWPIGAKYREKGRHADPYLALTIKRADQEVLKRGRKPAGISEDTPQVEGWSWRTLAHAYQPKEPRQNVVDGMLPLPSLSVAFGPPGTLKSMLLQDMAVCVVTGRPWLEGLPDQDPVTSFGCQQAPVLWIDVDNGLDRTERRFSAIGKAHGAPENAPLHYVSFPLPPFVASDYQAVTKLTDHAQEKGAKLIVVDNLGTISGGADENSAQMIGVMSGLRIVAETANAAVLVIHHKTKGEKQRAGNTLRGHSSIEAAVDLALMIEREEQSDSITLQSTKSRDLPIEPLGALWTYDNDGNELVKGRFYGLGKDEKKLSKFAKACKAIRDILEETPGLNQSQLVKAVKEADADLGKGTVLSAIRRLEKDGDIENRGDGVKNAKCYHLADPLANLGE